LSILGHITIIWVHARLVGAPTREEAVISHIKTRVPTTHVCRHHVTARDRAVFVRFPPPLEQVACGLIESTRTVGPGLWRAASLSGFGSRSYLF
jgi:hypothetical protein